MSTYRAHNDIEEILNQLLKEIVIEKGGIITGNDKITLLKNWLSAIGG